MQQAQERIENVQLAQIVPGNNPRRFFDARGMEELTESVRAKGVLQPVLLRPRDEGNFELVAGERRFRAASNAGLPTIPAVIREMNDVEAEEAALVENTQRADMSPTEEGRSAARLMALHENNRAEVVARLGWSENKLERRLALMNCVPEVQTALDEQKILLGHAELLAAAPQDKQNTVLGKIVEQNLSIATVKEALAKIAQRLDRAPFDTAGCLACSYNTSRQAMLFTEALAEGNCTNKACFLDKCMARVEELRKGLADEFPKVVVLAPGDPEIGVHVLPDGPMGVGIEQASACRGCAKFGATVNANPGKICDVEREVCFDEACRQEKVAAFLKARAEEKTEKAEKTASPEASKTTTKKKKAAPKATHVSPKVEEYRVKVWRKAAMKEVCATKEGALSLLIALAAKHQTGKIGSDHLWEIDRGLKHDSIASTARVADAVTPENREKTVRILVASAMNTLEKSDLISAMEYLAVDLGKHWAVDKEFLGLLTKSEMEALADEIGLKGHLDKEFPKVMSQKKDDIIKGLLSAPGFDFTGKVPGVMAYGK